MSDDGWFEVQRLPHGVTVIREPHHDEDVKSYLVEGERDVAVIDTGMGVGNFAGLVRSLSSRRPRVLQSHAHWDHVGGSHAFAEVLVHKSEAERLRQGFPAERFTAAFAPERVDRERLPAGFDPSAGLPGCEATGWLEDGQKIDLGGRVIEVIHTPGHSVGGVSFLDPSSRSLFVGDVLYLGAMYVFFADSDPAALRESLRRIHDRLDEVDAIYPAHGPFPITPDDVREIRDAYELIWSGRAPDRSGELFGIPLTVHEFGRFRFFMPGGDWRADIAG